MAAEFAKRILPFASTTQMGFAAACRTAGRKASAPSFRPPRYAGRWDFRSPEPATWTPGADGPTIVGLQRWVRTDLDKRAGSLGCEGEP
jgi:hypothetical protein